MKISILVGEKEIFTPSEFIATPFEEFIPNVGDEIELGLEYFSYFDGMNWSEDQIRGEKKRYKVIKRKISAICDIMQGDTSTTKKYRNEIILYVEAITDENIKKENIIQE